jgi:hypothetical protein
MGRIPLPSHQLPYIRQVTKYGTTKKEKEKQKKKKNKKQKEKQKPNIKQKQTNTQQPIQIFQTNRESVKVHGPYLYVEILIRCPPGSSSTKPISRNLRPISVERKN